MNCQKLKKLLPFVFFPGVFVALSGAGRNADGLYGFEKYVDALPIPPRIIVKKTQRKVPVDLDIAISQIQTSFHRDLPEGPAWSYNGSSPGPTIEVEKGTRLRVHWKNQLPATHIFKLPGGFMGMDPVGSLDPAMPDVRTVTHLHGAVVEQSGIEDRLHDNDGWPDAWIVPGQEQISEYPNDQTSRMLWYHDHAMASTGRNVAAGLYGAYLIHDSYERSLNLPSGDYDIPLIVQAMGFDSSGARYYTSDITAEFWGNSAAVNGKLWPYLNVEPRKYRFRFLNASNARNYGFKLFDFVTQQVPGPAFYQIGVDGGLLQDTAVLNDPADPHSPRLLLAPGERADVIIDFSQFAGKQLVLQNNSIGHDGEMPLPQIMLFKVAGAVTQPDTSALPLHPRPVTALKPSDATTTRQIVLSLETMGNEQMMMLNGKMWEDPISEKPVLGATEIWELVNTTTMMHPFHIHLVNFQMLDRRPFDVDQYSKTGQIVYTDLPSAPNPNEMGWKDVIQSQKGTVTRIIMKFAPYTGYYVYHCHILEHEDMDMMRPFQVISQGK